MKKSINNNFKFKRTSLCLAAAGAPRCPCGKKSTRVLTDANGDRYFRCDRHSNDAK